MLHRFLVLEQAKRKCKYWDMAVFSMIFICSKKSTVIRGGGGGGGGGDVQPEGRDACVLVK